MTQRTLKAATIVLASLVAACSSSQDYRAQYAGDLAVTSQAIDAGRLAEANSRALTLITTINENGVDGYEAQRALVDGLLVRLHAEANGANCFLSEPNGGKVLVNVGPASSGGSGSNGQDSPTAHRLAAIFHAGHLLEGSAVLQAAAADDMAAPDELRAFLDPGHAGSYAWLVTIASLAELGFTDKAIELLKQIEHPENGAVFRETDDLAADQRMLATLQDYGLPTHLQWQIVVVAHEIQKQRFESLQRKGNPTLAYRLGCIAAFGRLAPIEGTEYMEHDGNGLDDNWSTGFQRWVGELSEEGVFLSSTGTPFGGGVTACRSSGEPVMDFLWNPADR